MKTNETIAMDFAKKHVEEFPVSGRKNPVRIAGLLAHGILDCMAEAVALDGGEDTTREPDEARCRELAKEHGKELIFGGNENSKAVNEDVVYGAIIAAFAEYRSALKTQRSRWYRKYSAEQTAVTNLKSERDRLQKRIDELEAEKKL